MKPLSFHLWIGNEGQSLDSFLGLVVGLSQFICGEDSNLYSRIETEEKQACWAGKFAAEGATIVGVGLFPR